MKKVSIIVPMYYEEDMVRPCYTKLSEVMLTASNYEYELIFVNDGSLDRTLLELENLAQKDPHVKVISLSRNFGHQAAVSCGIKYATGEALVIIDADLQDPPELIPEMLVLWESGYEVVYGKREVRHGETVFKRLTAKLFYRILHQLSDVDIPLDTGDFRLIDRKVANVLNELTEHHRFLRGLVPWCGFKQIPILYMRQPRYLGETKYPFKKMIQLSLDGIITFSSKPLKFIMRLGVFALIVAIFTFIYCIIALISPHIIIIPALAWLMIMMTFLGGIQLISIGILGEYMARMYDESKNRPLYIVDKTSNLK